ncbi:hypothetical protein B0G75_12815 [Paraburkholderia sp. BL18I3N2]|nr:hypothetical protein B0G75_12815 [Paraburkholderia sp. BL18I3N2]
MTIAMLAFFGFTCVELGKRLPLLMPRRHNGNVAEASVE